jgi:thiamine-monophosphate kinase
MLEQKGRTELSELGEFNLIERIKNSVQLYNKTTVKGIGDDAAVIKNLEPTTVVSSDMLVEGVHFHLSYCPLKHLGYKAAVVNFSDIYAMNCIPEQITVNIAVSNRFSVEAIEEIYSGILLACEQYKVDLVGGDTTSSLSGLIISITVIGQSKEQAITYRKGAKKGDLIAVSGDLGAAFVGLQLLERERRIFEENNTVQPDLEGADYVLERQLKPEAQNQIVSFFHKHKIIPSAMIDISDGLASELLHITSSSEVGCNVYLEKIPIDTQTVLKAEEMHLDPITCALNGGEDYELLFTIDPKHYDLIKDWKEISIIGHITSKEEGNHLITETNAVIPITAQGWKSF